MQVGEGSSRPDPHDGGKKRRRTRRCQTFRCHICETLFRSRVELDWHRGERHKSPLPVVDDDERVENKMPKDLYQRVFVPGGQGRPENFTCLVCWGNFAREGDLHKHWARVHCEMAEPAEAGGCAEEQEQDGAEEDDDDGGKIQNG